MQFAHFSAFSTQVHYDEKPGTAGENTKASKGRKTPLKAMQEAPFGNLAS